AIVDDGHETAVARYVQTSDENRLAAEMATTHLASRQIPWSERFQCNAAVQVIQKLRTLWRDGTTYR
ncbi:MAG: hypothetical protein ACRC2B_23940, partial [Rubrivivax sp.]